MNWGAYCARTRGRPLRATLWDALARFGSRTALAVDLGAGIPTRAGRDLGLRHAHARRSPVRSSGAGSLPFRPTPANGCCYRSSMSLSSFWIAGSFMFSSVTTWAGIATVRGSTFSPFRILSMV